MILTFEEILLLLIATKSLSVEKCPYNQYEYERVRRFNVYKQKRTFPTPLSPHPANNLIFCMFMLVGQIQISNQQTFLK
jgi:hypothetical protein